jgi:hypothetical protein
MAARTTPWVHPTRRITRLGLAGVAIAIAVIFLLPTSSPGGRPLDLAAPLPSSSGGTSSSAPEGPAPALPVPTLWRGPVAENLTGSLSVNSSDVVDNVTSETWGTDVNIETPLNATATADLVHAGVTYVVWPSGAANDEYDYLTNELYAANGSTSTPKQNASEFVAWCESIDCHAIIGLPAEINNSHFAAGEVTYFEKTLHFSPAFWEMGNEPALWTNYNTAWDHWSASAQSTPAAMQYAILLKEYITAIHAVDASAQIIGLAGIGVSGHTGPTWVSDVMRVNGASIAAIALHVYPGSGPLEASGNLSDFDSTLTSYGSLEVRMPGTRQAIAEGCPKCTPQILLTEFNAAPVGAIDNSGNYAEFMDGFDNVPYIASEIVQGLGAGVSSLDLYDFKSSYPGAFLNESGQTRPIYPLFTTILPHLEPKVISTTIQGTVEDFFGIAATGRSNGHTVMTLLLANANPIDPVKLNVAALDLPTLTSTLSWSYTSSMSAPHETIWIGGPSSHWTIAPESVLLISYTY